MPGQRTARAPRRRSPQALTAVYLYPRLGPYARFLARELTPTPLTPVEGQRCVAVRGEQRHGAEEAFSGCEDFSMWTREGRGRMDVVAACDPHKEKWKWVGVGVFVVEEESADV